MSMRLRFDRLKHPTKVVLDGQIGRPDVLCSLPAAECRLDVADNQKTGQSRQDIRLAVRLQNVNDGTSKTKMKKQNN
jgi:hypothetical protein